MARRARCPRPAPVRPHEPRVPPALVDPRRAVPQPAGHHRRQLDPQRRDPDARTRPRRQQQPAPVDGRLVHARVRGPAAHRGQPRRPLRPARRAAVRHGRLRHRFARCRALVDIAEPADPHPRVHGHRRRVHHAGDVVDHHQRVPARRARPRDRVAGPRSQASRPRSVRSAAASSSSTSTGARSSS